MIRATFWRALYRATLTLAPYLVVTMSAEALGWLRCCHAANKCIRAQSRIIDWANRR